MKITTEKLPKSLLALQIELDKDRFERGLDQAARRLSQKFPIHGFRPGKAPRFMIERTFGREALIEEASDDLINKAFREALQREQITPVGPASLAGIDASEPFTFTVNVPVAPTVTLGDYRSIRVPLELEPITDEQLDRMMDVIRDRHVVLKELDEPRPAQEGDQLQVRLETIVDGEPLEKRGEDEPVPEQTLDLVQGRLVDELYASLIGANVGDQIEATATMSDDHGNEQVRGKEVTFKVEILGMQQRMLPDWEDVPTLEEFDGTLEELRAKTLADMEASVRNAAERKVLDSYIEQLVASTTFDVPDVMVHDLAESMLEDQGRQFARYGITLEQMLQYRGQTREDALEALMPEAEKQTMVTLALREVVLSENLVVSEDEIDAEAEQMLQEYDEDQRPGVAKLFEGQLRSSLASAALDKKLRSHLIAIATGQAPALMEAAIETNQTVIADAAPAEQAAPEEVTSTEDTATAHATTTEDEAKTDTPTTAS